MRLLALDVGNTNVTAGLFHDGRLEGQWRLASDRRRTGDEWWSALAAVTGGSPAFEEVVVGSVVPAVTEALERGFERRGVPVTVVRARDLPVPTPVDREEVGADRIANAVAVRFRHRLPAVVVDLGTATTVDVVGADGAYLGGAIAPGLMTGLQALVQGAARLSHVDLYVPETVVGRTTADCLRIGVLHGTAGLVDRLVELAAQELAETPCVVATGGFAERVAPVSRLVRVVDLDLTLFGLYHCWRMLREGARPYGEEGTPA